MYCRGYVYLRLFYFKIKNIVREFLYKNDLKVKKNILFLINI